jgi:hypothetical protein
MLNKTYTEISEAFYFDKIFLLKVAHFVSPLLMANKNAFDRKRKKFI